MKTLMFSFILFLGLAAVPAHAQLDINSLEGNAPILTFQPEYPRPGELVEVTANYRGDAFFGSTLTWIVDGEIVPNSKNMRIINIIAGESGVPQKVNVVFTPPKGDRVVSTATIIPLWLDVVIEPQTHVPEFYQGRGLPSVGSQVIATALISDSNGFIDPDLVYKWTINRKVHGNGSARGQNTISYETPMGKSAILTVEVSKLDGTVIGKRNISIPSVEPKLLFYEVNTLLGIDTKPVSENLSFVGNSTIVRAEPYNLDSRVYNNPSISEWEVNGIKNPNTNRSANPYEVMIETTGSTGRTFLQFHVRDTTQVLQGVDGRVNINI